LNWSRFSNPLHEPEGEETLREREDERADRYQDDRIMNEMTEPKLEACPWGCAATFMNRRAGEVRCFSHTEWMTIEQWNTRHDREKLRVIKTAIEHYADVIRVCTLNTTFYEREQKDALTLIRELIGGGE
jgi:hypothetical protein